MEISLQKCVIKIVNICGRRFCCCFASNKLKTMKIFILISTFARLETIFLLWAMERTRVIWKNTSMLTNIFRSRFLSSIFDRLEGHSTFWAIFWAQWAKMTIIQSYKCAVSIRTRNKNVSTWCSMQSSDWVCSISSLWAMQSVSVYESPMVAWVIMAVRKIRITRRWPLCNICYNR